MTSKVAFKQIAHGQLLEPPKVHTCRHAQPQHLILSCLPLTPVMLVLFCFVCVETNTMTRSDSTKGKAQGDTFVEKKRKKKHFLCISLLPENIQHHKVIYKPKIVTRCFLYQQGLRPVKCIISQQANIRSNQPKNRHKTEDVRCLWIGSISCQWQQLDQRLEATLFCYFLLAKLSGAS
jgi:hypothetical protein